MVQCIITFKIKEDKLDDAKALYREHFSAIRAAGERIESYEVWQSKSAPTELTIIKGFRCRADEKAHHGADHLQSFVKALGGVCAEKPNFREVELMNCL